MCKFSIIVPVYNVEKYIKQCIYSIQNQTFTDFECLIIDDCGNDKSIDIAQEMIQNDNRFKILKHEHNKGLSTARNTGIDNAKGEYIWFIDSDDWINEKSLEIINYIFENHDCDSVWFNILAHIEINHKLKILHDEKNTMNKTGFYFINPENIIDTTTYSWSKVFKTNRIQEYNIRFPDGLFFEETEFHFKYFTRMPKTYYVNDCLYNYRRRIQSIVTTSNKGGDRLLDMFKVFMNIYHFAKENNLFETYQKFLVSVLVRNIRNHAHKGMHEKVIKTANEILKEIDFPNAFSGEYD